MKVCVLASGSKGNSTYIETQEHKILIDVGVSLSYISQKLDEIGIMTNEIDMVLVTHTHQDHIRSLHSFKRRYNPKIYLTDLMNQELKEKLEDYEIAKTIMHFGELKVYSFKTSHDRLESHGYIFEENEKSIVYITDTGYINRKYNELLSNRSLYIFESNHDVTMLLNGNKQYHTKMRVLGDSGHLSNIDSANYLSSFIGSKTKKIFLAHLSEDDNSPEIALETLEDTFKEKGIKFNEIEAVSQWERTDLIEV